MTTVKKMTIKTLAEEFEKLKEEVIELRPLKKKVADLEEKLDKALTDKKVNVEEEEPLEKHEKCKICERSFPSVNEIKKHIKERHPKEIKCMKCAETFTKNSDLEIHIQNLHKEKEGYNCEECGKMFVLKWRLKKHSSLHTSSDIKGCHYFNNEKTCPFEGLGCMFAHKLMGACKFSKSCRNKLCSFQHKTENKTEDMFECQQCDKILKTHDQLIEHVENIHVGKESMPRDHLFPEKCPNCPGWIYSDTENEEHYDDFEEYGQCNFRKLQQ